MEQLSTIASERIDLIEKCVLPGRRPRQLGCNARVSVHGNIVRDQVVRVRTSGGGMGIGWSRIAAEQAAGLVGRKVGELFSLPEGTNQAGRPIDLPLWDLCARLAGLPLYRLLGPRGSREVEVYDGSIYIDDLELGDAGARELYARQVQSGWDAGYRNFKIKVGRGARWMPPAEGLARDALVIRTVREAAGPDAKILIDANMGNTLNTARELLAETADARLYWFEEPFAEDLPLNRALKEFIVENGWDTLVADGEFQPPPCFFDLVEAGWIDVVQQDFHQYGLTWWRAVSARLEGCAARCAPHTWGSYVERFTHAHFAASIPNFDLLEAEPAELPGLMADDWKMDGGRLFVPDTPGAGFDIEEAVWNRAVKEGGFSLRA
ncbi:MAG: hypothetical protein OXH50_20090 [Gemmatimonadetes bacterium]|nr:hypothetical protein [Gemmatimonadota bacterium]